MEYLVIQKEKWEEFKKNTIAETDEKEKAFVKDFFENAEKHAEVKDLPE